MTCGKGGQVCQVLGLAPGSELIQEVGVPCVGVVRNRVVFGSEVFLNGVVNQHACLLSKQAHVLDGKWSRNRLKWLVMPVEGFEPSTPYGDLFLRQARIPFRHAG